MSRELRVGLCTAAAFTVLGTIEVLLCLASLAQWQVVHSPGPANLGEALTLVLVAVAAGLGGWLALSTVAALLAHLPGRLGTVGARWASAWAPAVSRRVAAVLVGAAVGGALAPGTALGDGPATPLAAGPGFTTTASSTSVPGFITTASSTTLSSTITPSTMARSTNGPGFTTTAPPPFADHAPAPAPGWTPVRPVQRPQPASGLVAAGSARLAAADMVVHRGDTLWEIVRGHLGPDASDAEVANAWPAWHEANRAVIGDDPDLILPGQVLRAPSRAASAEPSGVAR